MTERLLIFDMDGVLVDVSESYRESIAQTVKHFTGTEISKVEIQGYKNRGGSNNDWDLSLEIIESRGEHPSRQQVIDAFQKIYLGENCTGLISRELWLADSGLLERLNRRFQFSLFTGREHWEAEFTLGKFAGGMRFDPIVGMKDVAREKPDPEGLLKIIRERQPSEAYYIGDVMDDCRAAQAAGVSFIGVVSEDNPLREELTSLFLNGQARAVIQSINELESVLP